MASSMAVRNFGPGETMIESSAMVSASSIVDAGGLPGAAFEGRFKGCDQWRDFTLPMSG